MSRKKLETVNYTLPAYWASYLVNGDASGLEDCEQDECDAFVESIGGLCCVDVSCEWFASRNDANNLGCEVAEFTFANYGSVPA